MVQIFKIPWASWYEPEELVMEFPDSWDIQLFDVKNVPEIMFYCAAFLSIFC